ncbi:hypothetical protein C8Q74DRAFT_1374202 [Fomes fomentarius]|nr:hypothetical protein C8Q74DRAFT_1374202 [Fomes fomentarius]
MAALDGTMGPLLIGVILGAVGTTASMVMYYYCNNHTRDPTYIKLLVGAVWVTDTAHQALISHTVYWYLVTTYGDPTALLKMTSTIIIEVLFQGFTTLFVQSFFAARIWKLGGKRLYILIPVGILIAAEFSVSTTYTIRALQLDTFADLSQVKALSLLINAFAAAADVIIAANLCTILHYSRTGFRDSNTLIDKLIVFSVNTGLLTSICACMSLITILALPHTFVYITFFFLIGRFYSNSMMATLNCRSPREGSSSEHDTSIPLRVLHPSAAAPQDHTASAIGIRIDRCRRSELTECQSKKYGMTDELFGVVEAV